MSSSLSQVVSLPRRQLRGGVVDVGSLLSQVMSLPCHRLRGGVVDIGSSTTI